MANLRLDCYKVFKVNLIDRRTNTILEGKVESKKSALIESNAERTILATDHSNVTNENGHEDILRTFHEVLTKYFDESCQWKVLDKDLLKLFKVPPSKMKETLDMQNIEQIENLAEEKFDLIGAQVPSDVASVLLPLPDLPIRVGMIVAYEDEENDCFIYAEIREIHGDNAPSSYITIDTKSSLIKVRILEVCFFPPTKSRTAGLSSRDVVHDESGEEEKISNNGAMELYQGDDEIENPFDDNKDHQFEKPLKDLLLDITEQLEKEYAILKSDDKAWKKFVKRMYLKWHPDKNPGNQEVATEVVKHIQNEVKRIEEGKPRAGATNGFNSSHNNGHYRDTNFWEDLFDLFDRYARSQRSQYDEYRSNYRRNYNSGRQSYSGFGVPPSFKTNDINASRRWFQEAQEDIKVAEFNLQTHPHASAYFVRMCIERSVKAAELTCQPTFTMTHDIGDIIRSLPPEIRVKLEHLWSGVPDCFRIYSHIMYKGLNGNTGERPSSFFSQKRKDLTIGIEIAKDILNTCGQIINEAM